MRNFTFRNSKGSYSGIPIIAANMDTVGTFEMALALHQVGVLYPRKEPERGRVHSVSVCELWINKVLFEQSDEDDESGSIGNSLSIIANCKHRICRNKFNLIFFFFFRI